MLPVDRRKNGGRSRGPTAPPAKRERSDVKPLPEERAAEEGPDGTLAGMNQVIAWVAFSEPGCSWPGHCIRARSNCSRKTSTGKGSTHPSPASHARPRLSPWWWLLPPVMYLIRRHRSAAFRQAALAQLTQAQRDQSTSIINKATGWFTVALGAALRAAEQTWQVIERQHWRAWLFWILIIVMLGVSVLNTALKIHGRAAEPAAHRADEDSST